MSASDTARETILQRIRAALRDVPAGEQPEEVVVARDYRHNGSAAREEVVEQFIERVADYKVIVQRVEESALPQAIAEACAARGVQYLVVPADLPASWLPPHVELLPDANTLGYEQLDKSDGVLTGCALAIAQTGTIVLNGGPSQGRRAITLLPDYHLCVVFENQIVDLVPEALANLRDAVLAERRPITFISGPSATSDIELNRVEGVHGPRTLQVLVVRNA
ncbi:MAG TPA: lactate utilization protein C [Ktedonobacteraceae bacterium]|nr:lactate utilization protein C [Ktedonobacteraceae bacterium]